MIRVAPQPEPEDFEDRVRAPGKQYLQSMNVVTPASIRTRPYWQRALPELHSRYNGVCAYSCHWIPFDTGAKSVEHFVPIASDAQLAYEWENYRLVCATLNSRKGIRKILDPFEISEEWFQIEFPSLLVSPSANLAPIDLSSVVNTIDILKLNDEGTCLKARFDWVQNFCLQHISFEFLRRRAPFLAKEIARLGLEDTLEEIMSFNG